MEIKDITDIIVYVIAIASLVVKVTPTLEDDAWLAKILAALKTISLNKK